MSDLAKAFAQHEARLEDLKNAKETVKDIKNQVESAYAEVVAAAAVSEDETLRELAVAIGYANDQISRLTDPENDEGQKALMTAVKELGASLRAAARGKGDPKSVEAELTEAEEKLGEMKAVLAEHKRNLRTYQKVLLKAAKAEAAKVTF